MQKSRAAINLSLNLKLRAIISKVIALSSILMTLSGCSVYSQQFGCPDSKGARCVMLSDVDQMIDNHEIKEVYRDKKNCSKGKCLPEGLYPKLKKQGVVEVELEEGGDDKVWRSGDKLYLKQ